VWPKLEKERALAKGKPVKHPVPEEGEREFGKKRRGPPFHLKKKKGRKKDDFWKTTEKLPMWGKREGTRTRNTLKTWEKEKH